MSGITVNTQIYKGTTLINFLAYRTSIQLCTGIGSLEIEVPLKSVNASPYNEIIVYQNGQKSGVYYVVDVSHDYTSGVTIIRCQDGSKKLTDYYVVNNTTYDYPTTTKSHITRILNEVGVSYQFDVRGDGSILAPGAMFGQASAYDLINQLVQQSGWYFYFDGDGVMRIGDLPPNDTNIKTLSEYNGHLEISVQKNSETMRNKAIVWGNIDPETSKQVVAVAEKSTGYEMTDRDIRPIVISSPYIYYTSDAANIANKLLSEFATITETLTVTAAGFYPDYNVKDAVRVTGRYVDTTGVITSKSVEFSPSGAITTFIINEKCPRLVAIYYYGGYVYVGTKNNGVWRKPIRWKHIWESFNSGISTEDYEITDLKVRNGIFACIANKKVYVRGRGSFSWIKYNVPIFYDEDTNEESNPEVVIPTSVSINPDTYKIEAIFVDTSKHISWVVRISTAGYTEEILKVKDINNVSLRGVSISHFNNKKVISAIKPHNFDDLKFDYPTINYSAYANNSPGYVYGRKIYFPKVDFNRKYKIWFEIYDMDTDSLTETQPVLDVYKSDAGGAVGLSYIRKEGDVIFLGVLVQNYYYPTQKLSLEFGINISSMYVVSITQLGATTATLSSVYYAYPRFNGRKLSIGNAYSTSSKNLYLSINDITNYDYTAKDSVTVSVYVGGKPSLGNPPKFNFVAYKDMPDYGVYYFRSDGAWGSSILALMVIIWYEGTTIQYEHEILDWLGSNNFYPSIVLSAGAKYALVKDLTNNVWYFQDLVVSDHYQISGVTAPQSTQRYCIKNLENLYYVDGSQSYKNFVLQNDVNFYKYIIDETKFVDIGFSSSAPYQIVINGERYNIKKTANCPDLLRADRYDNYIDGGVLFIDNYAIFPDDRNFIDQYGTPGGYLVLKESTSNNGKFEPVGYTTAPVVLEIPNEYPILTYPVPTSSYVFSGIFPSGLFNPLYSGAYGILSDLKYSFTGEYGSLMPVVSGAIVSTISGYPLDTRGYYEMTPSGTSAFTVFTPVTLLPEGTALLSVYQDELYFLTTASGIVTSGYPVRVESFSNLDYPYLFTAVSGVDRVYFYQRDGNTIEPQTFIDRTNNLPDDWINVIRADELA